jgi:signal transduction histidine kinase
MPRCTSGAAPAELEAAVELEASGIGAGIELLALGGASELPGLSVALERFGVRLVPARGDPELLARLARDASRAEEQVPELLGVLLGPEPPESEMSRVVELVRRSPLHQNLPILVPSGPKPPADTLDVAPGACSEVGEVAAGSREVAPALSAAPVVLRLSFGSSASLESELALLLELHRARTSAARYAARAEQARGELLEARASSAAFAEQARAFQAELETSQAQLVQASKLALLGELVAEVAHEINGPLAFSLSHLGTIQSGVSRCFARLGQSAVEPGEERVRLEERLRGVILGLNRIKGLVVKLQTFSRMDDGQRHPVRVAEAIGTILAIVEHRMDDRIHLTTELREPEVIQCDPALINQCVMNLVVNAIDAIEGEGKLAIVAGAEADRYVIRVRDSGVGVPIDLRQRIFDPFFTTKPAGKGTGLGLSIASTIVKKHGGTLALDRCAEGGTEAVISLPLSQLVLPRRAAAAAR